MERILNCTLSVNIAVLKGIAQRNRGKVAAIAARASARKLRY